jgi:hypothetical protein
LTTGRKEIAVGFEKFSHAKIGEMITVTCSMSTAHGDLVAWATSHGAIVPSTLDFPSSPHSGSCIQTSVAVPAGTPLFHIPPALVINPAKARVALPDLDDDSFSTHQRMCTFIALERRKADGFWRPYFAAVPETFRTPAYFTGEELKVLEGTNLEYAWMDRVKAWKEEFESVQSVIPDIQWLIGSMTLSLTTGTSIYGLQLS